MRIRGLVARHIPPDRCQPFLDPRTTRLRKFARPCIVAIGTAQFVLPYGCAYAQNQLTVEVAGTIEQACSISVGNAFGAVSLERSGSAQATANVDCNTGFEIDARSDAGGFAAKFRTPNGFDASLPYAFDFALPLENGSTMRKNCTSSEMKSRACLMGSGALHRLAKPVASYCRGILWALFLHPETTPTPSPYLSRRDHDDAATSETVRVRCGAERLSRHIVGPF